MRIPRHGNADGSEAGFLEHVDEFAGGVGLPPGVLVVGGSPFGEGFDPHALHVAAVGLQGVSQVPAHAHVPRGGSRIFPAARFGIDGVGLLHGEVEADGRGLLLVLLVASHRSGRKGDHVAAAAGEPRDLDRQVFTGNPGPLDIGASVHRNAVQAFGLAKDVLVEGEDDGKGGFDESDGSVRRRRGDEHGSGDLRRGRSLLFGTAAGNGEDRQHQRRQKISKDLFHHGLEG